MFVIKMLYLCMLEHEMNIKHMRTVISLIFFVLVWFFLATKGERSNYFNEKEVITCSA